MNKSKTDLTSAMRSLAKQGWFSQRSPATRARFSAIARLCTFKKDEMVYMAGDPANGVFGLVSGSLNISYPRGDGEDYTVHRAGGGFWIGDVALLAKGGRLVSVRAAEPTTMVHLPMRDLARLIRDDPRLYADFYALTYENFRTTLQIVANLAITSAEKRLADRLLTETAGGRNRLGWLSITQADLAKLLALSVPTLQRAMRRFEKAGLIKREYKRIQVLDHDGLIAVCRG
jgi:CRP/FNR family transcriptional regulator, cyclic AMP receptor protein